MKRSPRHLPRRTFRSYGKRRAPGLVYLGADPIAGAPQGSFDLAFGDGKGVAGLRLGALEASDGGISSEDHGLYREAGGIERADAFGVDLGEDGGREGGAHLLREGPLAGSDPEGTIQRRAGFAEVDHVSIREGGGILAAVTAAAKPAVLFAEERGVFAVGDPNGCPAILGVEGSCAGSVAGVADGILMGGGEPEAGTAVAGKDGDVFDIPLMAEAAAVAGPEVVIVQFDIGTGGERLAIDGGRGVGNNFWVRE